MVKILDRILELNNKWKRKYNKLCIQYEELANRKLQEIESENEMLSNNISYRDEIERLKAENMKYRRKFGRLEGGDKNDKNKNKR